MGRTTIPSAQVRNDTLLIEDLKDFAVIAATGLGVTVLAGRVKNDNTITDKADQSLTLTDNTTNYVEIDSLGVASFNTTGFTAGKTPLATIVTASGAISTITDKRSWVGVSTGTLGVVVFQIGDGINEITTSLVIPVLEIKRTGTIVSWDIFADVSGAIQLDIQKSAGYAGLPTFTSIVASAPPSLSSAQKNQSSTLTGWTTAITAGDWMKAIISSATTVKQVTIVLNVRWSS
jgi:hypothetical protein